MSTDVNQSMPASANEPMSISPCQSVNANQPMSIAVDASMSIHIAQSVSSIASQCKAINVQQC
eukprot:954216-Lingulodinium_polyedra.AAC.1